MLKNRQQQQSQKKHCPRQREEKRRLAKINSVPSRGDHGSCGKRVASVRRADPRLFPTLATCVMVVVSLGKTLHPPCHVWMCLTDVCFRWWSEGSCGYYRSLPPPVRLWVNEWNLEPCQSTLSVLKSAIQIQSNIIIHRYSCYWAT